MIALIFIIAANLLLGPSGNIVVNIDNKLMSTAATPTATPTATPAACIEDSYSETNRDTDFNIFTGSRSAIGQSFTPSFSGDMATAVWYLSKTGAPTGNAVAKLYAHSGTYGTSSVPTGSALATSRTFDVSTLSTITQDLTPFHFDSPFSLVSGTHYVVTIEYVGGDASNFIQVGHQQFSPSHGGNASSFNGSWSAFATRDCIFYVETCWFMGCASTDTPDCSPP